MQRCFQSKYSKFASNSTKCLHFSAFHYKSKHVCITFYRLTSTQYSLTAGLHLTKIFQTLRIFVHWTEEGRYDFCSMPFVAKMPMSLPDEDAIMQIQDQYDGEGISLTPALYIAYLNMYNTLVHV